MAGISNFTQAVKELTGFDEVPESGNNSGTSSPDIGFERKDAYIKSDRIRTEINMPIIDNQGSSIVTSTMVVKGNVEGRDDLKVEGKILGDVNISSSIASKGTIVGNVSGDNLSLDGPIKGNVSAKGNLRVGNSSIIAGDVSSHNIAVDGKIKGNLSIKESTSLSEEAWILGDINTGSLVTDVGCIINGNITTKDVKEFVIDEAKLFDIGE